MSRPRPGQPRARESSPHLRPGHSRPGTGPPCVSTGRGWGLATATAGITTRWHSPDLTAEKHHSLFFKNFLRDSNVGQEGTKRLILRFLPSPKEGCHSLHTKLSRSLSGGVPPHPAPPALLHTPPSPLFHPSIHPSPPSLSLPPTIHFLPLPASSLPPSICSPLLPPSLPPSTISSLPPSILSPSPVNQGSGLGCGPRHTGLLLTCHWSPRMPFMPLGSDPVKTQHPLIPSGTDAVQGAEKPPEEPGPGVPGGAVRVTGSPDPRKQKRLHYCALRGAEY